MKALTVQPGVADSARLEAAVAAMFAADLKWLASLIIRRVPLCEWQRALERDPDGVKTVTGVRGEVAMRMELVLHFDYGDVIP